MRTARIARETELLSRLVEREGASAGRVGEDQEAEAEASRSLESAGA